MSVCVCLCALSEPAHRTLQGPVGEERGRRHSLRHWYVCHRKSFPCANMRVCGHRLQRRDLQTSTASIRPSIDTTGPSFPCTPPASYRFPCVHALTAGSLFQVLRVRQLPHGIQEVGQGTCVRVIMRASCNSPSEHTRDGTVDAHTTAHQVLGSPSEHPDSIRGTKYDAMVIALFVGAEDYQRIPQGTHTHNETHT